jgi:hypothetical protein
MDCIIDETGQLIIMRGEADIERGQRCLYRDGACGDWCPYLVESEETIYLTDRTVKIGKYLKTCVGHKMNLIQDRRKS